MARIVASEAAEGGRAEQAIASIGAIWSHRPELAGAIARAQQILRETGTLTPRLRELVRLRIAFHNQCRTCMAVRFEPDAVSEDLVCSLEKPAEAPDLTDGERAALRFADLFCTNHLAIDDAVYDGLRSHFSEGELVELGTLCALMSGMGRLAATWHVVDMLPEDYRGDGTITPWGHVETLDVSRIAAAS